jgi:hypothetical protein
MPYGYLGTTPNQQLNNSGVFSVEEALALKNVGELGGSLQLIESQTISGTVAQVDFTSIKESKYDVHLLILSNMLTENNNKRTTIRFFESGVIETGSVYQTATQVGTAGGTFSEVKSTSSDDIRITDNTGSDTGESSNTYVYCYNLGNSAKYSFVTCQSVGTDGTPTAFMEFGGGVLPQASTVDGIRVLGNGSQNLTGGNLKLYGVKQI